MIPRAFILLLLVFPMAAPAGQRELWRERVKSVVAVEFFTATELDRRQSVVAGTVVDGNGTIILPSHAVGERVTPGQLRDFRVYRPGEPTISCSAAEYLGVDRYTGWHFIRVEEKGRAGLVPVTAHAVPGAPEPDVTDGVWGIGLRKKDEDFAPYFLSGTVGIIAALPQRTAVAAQEVTGIGLPVYDHQGTFVGLGIGGFGQTFIQFSSRDSFGLPVVLVNSDECSAFLLASEVVPHLARIPKNVTGRPIAWLGAHGLQPVDPEVARFLRLESAAAIVVSEILAGSPAEKAGMQPRDILLELDGEPLPVLKPDRVIVPYFEKRVELRSPGEVLKLTVLRGTERLVLPVQLDEAPELPVEARRKYFERLGVTVRAFTFEDGVERRAKPEERDGVIVHFVKASTPIANAGLRAHDWIREIDGAEITTLEEAVAKLEAIEADPQRQEIVLLTKRGGETAVLRVKLK